MRISHASKHSDQIAAGFEHIKKSARHQVKTHVSEAFRVCWNRLPSRFVKPATHSPKSAKIISSCYPSRCHAAP